ncbi:MAG: serine hydrolase domain-containing protein, partial [Bacteroidota bacterium]
MKGISQLIVLAFLSLMPITLWAQLPANDTEATEWAREYFAKVQTQEKGGAVLAVVRDGEIVFQAAYGMANLEYGIPNDSNTVFHAASLSKQFTAYAALQLEQQGKLSMDDDVRKYVPEVPDFGHPITLRQLANHMSGLRDQWNLLYLAGWRTEDVIFNQDILDLVTQQDALNFVPGTKVMYSNTGFTLLAEVVARVSGKTFAEYTQENLFGPLEMTNSQFYDDHQKVVPNRAYSYQEKDGNVKKHRLNFATVGATSLFTTVPDLCKWAVHLNTLEATNSTLAKNMNQLAKLNNGELTESANGQWGSVKFNGMEWFDHSGSDASYRAYFSRFPESNSAAIILANATPVEASGLALGLAELFLHPYFVEDKAEKKDEAATIAAREKTYALIQLPAERLRQFCGKYWEPEERYDRTIKIVNDTLIYYRSEDSQTKLVPVAPNEFKMLGDAKDVSVFFETDELGEPTMRLNIADERTVHFVKYATGIPLPDTAGSYFSKELNSTLEVSVADGSVHLRAPKRA